MCARAVQNAHVVVFIRRTAPLPISLKSRYPVVAFHVGKYICDMWSTYS